MPSPAELVAALSRAYALTDVFPAGDPVSLDALGHLRGLLREGAVVEVSSAGLRVDGIDVPDFHGGSGRFARDLRVLGVEELHFGEDLHVEALERFVRVLREDALEGGMGRLRPETHGSGIDVVFQGELGAPGEETEVIPFPQGTLEWGPDGEEDSGSRPGQALVASIAGLFGPSAAPSPPSPPLSFPVEVPDERDPGLVEEIEAMLGRELPDERDPGLVEEIEAMLGRELPDERDPGLVEEIEAMLGRELPDERDPGPVEEIEAMLGRELSDERDAGLLEDIGAMLDREAPAELELDPHFGWAPDPDAELPRSGALEAGLDASSLDDLSRDASSLDLPEEPAGDEIRPQPRSFAFPSRPGSRRSVPGGDPDWDPFDAREAMTRARSEGRGEERSQPAPPPPGNPAGPAASLPFASEGIVGEASFGRRLDPGGNQEDSPSSVRDASFADPETMGEAHFGHSEPSSGSRENKPFLDWPAPRQDSPGVKPAPAAPLPSSPGPGTDEDPFGDLLGLPGEGTSSHALFFFDDDVGVEKGGELPEVDLLASPPTPEGEEPVVQETEVEPPEGEWDREAATLLVDREPPVESDSGEEEVPLWHLEPEVPIWDRQEEGSVEPERTEEGETLDTLVHRVLIGFGDQKRRAMDELRARATPTLNPVILDEFVNAVLDLLRAQEGGTGLRDLARDLTTHGVASRLVARLGQERDAEARRELSALFARLGEPMSRALVDALVDEPDRGTRRIYLEALASMGPEGVGAVHRMLNDARWFVVRNGLALLGDMGDPGAVPRIVPVLAHPDSRVRREAVVALARLAGDDIPRILQQRLGDPSGEVRAAAAAGLGVRKVEGAAPALMGMLDAEKDPIVLEAVMGALGELGEPAAVALLEKRAVGSLLSRPPTQLRVAAYRALHAIGTPHARSLVQAAASDRDPGVRAAVAALQEG
jgi:HEAT repeat protein